MLLYKFRDTRDTGLLYFPFNGSLTETEVIEGVLKEALFKVSETNLFKYRVKTLSLTPPRPKLVSLET
jgi:hypothetical protein